MYHLGLWVFKTGNTASFFGGRPCRSTYIVCGTASITTLSHVGQRQWRKGEGSNEDTWETCADVSTVCKELRLKEAEHVLDLMEQRGFGTYSETCAHLLQGFAKRKALADGKMVHAHIIKSGFETDLFLENTLVSMYVKCGSVVEAREVFHKMPERDVVSWNAMIAGCAQQGRGEEAFKLFQEMNGQGVRPNKITFMNILKACGSPVVLEQGKRVHASIVKCGFESDVRVGTALVSMYCKCGSLVDASGVFDNLPHRDVISWNAMIGGFAQHRHGEKAFKLFQQMQGEGVRPNKITFMSILNACSSPETLQQGEWLHACITKAGFGSDIRVGNALVSMYSKCGSLVDARLAFDNLPKRDVISWTAMIAASAQHGYSEEAFDLYRQMEKEGLKPDKVTFMSMLKACASLGTLEQGKWLHVGIIKAGFEADVRVGNALVSMYCKCGSVADARQVFFKMPERNVVTWNGIIAGLAQEEHGAVAFELFQQMHKEGMKPDKITFMSILNACAIPAALEQGKCVHACIIEAGFESDVHVGTALVSMYCNCECVVDAWRVFFGMPERNVVSWTAMITGFAQHGHGEEALELFRQMQQEGLKPNKGTLASVLNACASLAALEEGKKVHANIIASGFESDVCLGSALVDMYTKCGSVGKAREVFDKLLDQDVVSWTGMITGYAQHGHAKEALQLFEQMQGGGVKPNEVTFIGVLSACSHMGLVEEGHHYFLAMINNHSITPTEKHYACMVDLLGRAGRLEEAENFIINMTCKPDATVWGALLGACKIHGNVELAEHAAENILKLESRDAGVLMLL